MPPQPFANDGAPTDPADDPLEDPLIDATTAEHEQIDKQGGPHANPPEDPRAKCMENYELSLEAVKKIKDEHLRMAALKNAELQLQRCVNQPHHEPFAPPEHT